MGKSIQNRPMATDQFTNLERITVKLGEAAEDNRAFGPIETPDRQQAPIGLDIFQTRK